MGDAASLALVVRASLNALELPSKSSKHPADEDHLMQVPLLCSCGNMHKLK